jgi:hypothetical protein
VDEDDIQKTARLSLLHRVKKSQEKNSEIYKQQHLAAVQKNHAKDPEKYKQKNLAAVKKSNSKDPEKYKQQHLAAVQKHQNKFPPTPPSLNLQHSIISNYCKDISSQKFTESGCAVCGKLAPLTELYKLSKFKLKLDILIQENVTKNEQLSSDDPIDTIKGPVLENKFDTICKKCQKSISAGKRPKFALANGIWLGNVPKELSDLSYVEQLLVARIRHNRCIVRVSSGMHKMRANAITFANPTPKIYDILPPHSSELDEVLAFIYTGPCKPTKADFERTPLLVRRNKVAAALKWLILNHSDYYDVEISKTNLESYSEDEPPVVIDYRLYV